MQTIEIRARVTEDGTTREGWLQQIPGGVSALLVGPFQPDTLPHGETMPLTVAPFERTEGEAMRELAFVRRELDDAKIPDRLGDVALLTRERVHMLAKTAANDAVQALQAVQGKVAEAEALRGELAANRMALDTLRALVGDAAGILVEAREHLKLRGQIGDRAIAWIKEWSILGGGS